jgi:hypothetical protein
MSDQEQHAIIGQTALELSNEKRKLAALQVKAQGFASQLKSAADDLANFRITSVERLERIPGGFDVLSVLGEIRDTKARINELGEALRGMGVA